MVEGLGDKKEGFLEEETSVQALEDGGAVFPLGRHDRLGTLGGQ